MDAPILSVVIPASNESKTIVETLDRVHKAPVALTMEIIVSPCAELPKRGITLLTHGSNQG